MDYWAPWPGALCCVLGQGTYPRVLMGTSEVNAGGGGNPAMD